jgi:hypothetical protein
MRLLCAVELSSEREAIRVAKRMADRLAETSNARPGDVIVVTDEHGNQICEAIVPSKQ